MKLPTPFRSTPLLLCPLLCVACALTGSCGDTGAERSTVDPSAASTFLLPQKDLPFPAILWRIELDPPEQPAFYRVLWYGPAARETGATRMADSHVMISVEVMSSADAALDKAEHLLHENQAPARDVTGTAPLGGLGERVWYTEDQPAGGPAAGAWVLFVRRNVLVQISVFQGGGVRSDAVCALAGRVRARIDAALQDKAKPAPALPLSADELHVGLQAAWDMDKLGKTLGEGGTTIALQSGDGLARAVPAIKADDSDYLIPLRHIVGVVQPGSASRVKLENGTARVNLWGKDLSFTIGKPEVQVGKVQMVLAQPAQCKDGCAFVPLSSLMKALGRSVTWGQVDSMPLARF